MAKKLSSVLGIDIGSRKIKVAEVKGSGKEPMITALAVVDTPEGAVDHTGVYNSDAVGDAIKRAIAEAGATSTHMIVSIAGQASVLVRTLEVPKMNSNELKDHMQWEISRNIPFSESTVESAYAPLGGEEPNSTNMDVVMAISPRSAIDTLMACAKKAGKRMAAIDVEPLGLARSLMLSYGADYPGKTVCVVDIGHKTTSINLYRDGKLLMPRQVPIGGEMFTRAIMDALSVSEEEAEAMKKSKLALPVSAAGAINDPFGSFGGATQQFTPYNPFDQQVEAAPYVPPLNPYGGGEGQAEAVAPTPAPEPEPEPEPVAPVVAAPAVDAEAQRLNSAVASVLDEFVAEVRRSLDYFRSRGGDVDHVMLCGGGARIQNLASFLGSALGLACDVYDPLRHLNVNAKKASPEFIDEHRQELAVAVGNSLHIFF